MNLSVATAAFHLLLTCGLPKFTDSLNVCLTAVNPVQNLAFGIPPKCDSLEQQKMWLAAYW